MVKYFDNLSEASLAEDREDLISIRNVVIFDNLVVSSIIVKASVV